MFLQRSKNVICSMAIGFALFGAAPNLAMAQSAPQTIGEDNVNITVEEKGKFTPGESSSIEPSDNKVHLPAVINGDDDGGGEIEAASVSGASWRDVIYDEFVHFPNNWSVYDYNGTGYEWVHGIVQGWNVATPSFYVNKMNTRMTTDSFSLHHALDARVKVRFLMDTESNYDFFRYEYHCGTSNGDWHSTNYGARSGISEPVNGTASWITRTYPLECEGYDNVKIRFTFQTDASVTYPIAPALDYVKIQQYK